MKIGILTGPFGGEPLSKVIEFASSAGFDSLEIASGPGSKHIDPTTLTAPQAEAIRKELAAAKLEISSLAMYSNMTEADPEKRAATSENLRKCIDAAEMLGTSVVCTLAGFPVPGKDKNKTIEEDCPAVFVPLCEYAASKGIKIALENYFATNIQNLDHWDRIFRAVPNENFGLNFDPSHLYWQGIDYLHAVDRFANRIFHTHAKDCEVNAAKLAVVGNQAGGWWRYVIPGFGRIAWGEYAAALRRNGFNGVMSIEHEDGALGREEGFLKGKAYLSLFA